MSSKTDKTQSSIARLTETAKGWVDQFNDGETPKITLPTRTKSNIVFDEDSRVWVLGEKTSSQTANTVKGAKKLLKKAYAAEFVKNQLAESKSSTLRELYYISESWDNKHAKFSDQDESNQTIEDLEVYTGLTREDMHLRPEESGATLIGPLTIREQTRRGERIINCQEDVGEGGYQIPSNPETIDFVDCDADFVLAVETGGMRDRLVENGFDESYNALIVHLKGQPSRSTRRIIRRLNGGLDLPVVVFTDGDPWSYRIFGSVAYGSIKSAHLSEHLATPDAMYLGIRPQDIVDYELPSDPLSDSDVNALKSELDDPRFSDNWWTEQIELQLEIGKKSEQQALASRGLDFVTDEYLPTRLEEMGVIN
jgi:DNA topoisomerase-6 subunit A